VTAFVPFFSESVYIVTVYRDLFSKMASVCIHEVNCLYNGLYSYKVLNASFCMYGASLCYCVSVGLF